MADNKSHKEQQGAKDYSKGKKHSKLTIQGIQRARERGVKLGRPRLTLPPGFDILYKEYKEGNLMARDFAKTIGRHRSTLYRYIDYYEEQQDQQEQQEQQEYQDERKQA